MFFVQYVDMSFIFWFISLILLILVTTASDLIQVSGYLAVPVTSSVLLVAIAVNVHFAIL